MTTELSPGIYRISTPIFGSDPEYITRLEEMVTIRPSGARPNPEQEWRISHGGPGNIIIEGPSKIIPNFYLTYQGDGEPKRNDLIEVRHSESPLNEWSLEKSKPESSYIIRVAGTGLGIRIGPLPNEPPVLELGFVEELDWTFDRLRDE